MCDSDTTPIPHRRILSLRRARRVQGAAGLLLASCFLMPAVTSCKKPLVPAREVYQVLSDSRGGPSDVVAVFTLCVAPYLLGLLTFLIAVRSRTYAHHRERFLGASVAVLLGTTVAIFVTAECVETMRGNPPPPGLLVITVISSAFWMTAVRRGMGGLLCIRWLASVCAVIWFTRLSVDGSARYGVRLSALAATVMLIALTAEARIRNRSGWLRTIGALLACRLTLFHIDEPRCDKCGYLLIGLTGTRCPECGTHFAHAPPIPASPSHPS